MLRALRVVVGVLSHRATGTVALILVGVVIFTGTFRDRGQDQATRQVACAVARFAGGPLITYFESARGRLVERRGTPEELSTDVDGQLSLETVIAAFTALRNDLNGRCGRIVVVHPPG